MIDVFYSGIKPNVFAYEREATSIDHARELCSSTHFWWINHLSDYSNFNFDFFPPDRTQARQRHAWPSQHQKDGGTYYVPKYGYVDTNYHTDCVVPRVKSDWGNGDLFDYTWHPDPTDPPYIYIFGNQWYGPEKMPTIEYKTPGATDYKYMYDLKATLPPTTENWCAVTESPFEFDYSWIPDPYDPPFIYVFGNQWHSAEVMPTLEYRTPGATERKYVRDLKATLLEDKTLWEVPSTIDESTVDFSWVPDPGSPPYIYQFSTQHQLSGGPRYVIPGAVQIKYVSHMDIKVTLGDNIAIYEIDHGDGNAGNNINVTKTVPYFSSYLDTLIRIARNIDPKYKFIWVCSSVCDYTNFDFSWHPQLWQEKMLHVFSSNGQKFGDTFYINVENFLERIYDYESLEEYELNFTGIDIPRRPMPVVKHTHDAHIDAIKEHTWAGPLALFTIDTAVDTLPTVSLWDRTTKTVVPLSAGASQVIVPKNVMPYLKTQVYDYPYIDKTHQHLGVDQPLDIVFIDNGEREAEHNWQFLKENVSGWQPNKLLRSSGVNGRAAAYRAAAELSTTPWFFAVFAKLEINTQFDWLWQPDRLQEPKHYIFHAHNPVTGLEYGHQAMIAYNKKLVLENTAQGLDFTLDQAHEVVPLLSGTANYHTDAWTCWRTAFRECIKLRDSLPNTDNEYRLEQWLTVDNTTDGWSIKGAEDAVEYYNSVDGDFSELKKSYDWEWLASYAFTKRNLSPSQ